VHENQFFNPFVGVNFSLILQYGYCEVHILK
jgi:hypothetical protein